MSDSQGDSDLERKKPSSLSCRTPDVLAEFTELNQIEEDGVDCSSGAPTFEISPEANIELQQTILEVGLCTDGNYRLSTICTRYVEALNEKHRLAQQLREERALRAKVLETKNRLVSVCKRLQEQSVELRKENCSDENEKRPNEEHVVMRTHFGMVRKHRDFVRFVERDLKNGETGTKNESAPEEKLQKTRSLHSKSTLKETKSVENCEKISSESQLMQGNSYKMPLNVISEVSLAEKNVDPNEEVQVPRIGQLSFVAVSQYDIPPIEQICQTKKIGVSWASTDLTRR